MEFDVIEVKVNFFNIDDKVAEVIWYLLFRDDSRAPMLKVKGMKKARFNFVDKFYSCYPFFKVDNYDNNEHATIIKF